MDGLPIVEAIKSPFKSKAVSRMHGCGHDAHMSMLLGAAKMLKQHDDALPGTVLLMFQPAEEGGGGAKLMVEAGALKGVSRVFGMHGVLHSLVGWICSRNYGRYLDMVYYNSMVSMVRCSCVSCAFFDLLRQKYVKNLVTVSNMSLCRGLPCMTKGRTYVSPAVWPMLPSGVIASRAGTIMAASDRLLVTITGRGGHAAIPHLANDPVIAASAVVMALQPLVSRETSPADSAVLSITRFNTGASPSSALAVSRHLFEVWATSEPKPKQK